MRASACCPWRWRLSAAGEPESPPSVRDDDLEFTTGRREACDDYPRLRCPATPSRGPSGLKGAPDGTDGTPDARVGLADPASGLGGEDDRGADHSHATAARAGQLRRRLDLRRARARNR